MSETGAHIESATLLLDTNVVMHYEFMDTINWPAIVGAKRVLIVVHPELMRELNELKDSKDKAKKTGERADTVHDKRP